MSSANKKPDTKPVPNVFDITTGKSVLPPEPPGKKLSKAMSRMENLQAKAVRWAEEARGHKLGAPTFIYFEELAEDVRRACWSVEKLERKLKRARS